jgi:feruloyl esterase
MRCVLLGLNHAASVLCAALIAALFGVGATPAIAATCASLAGLALPDTTITAAEPVAAGTYTAPDGEVFANLPAFCRIAATLTPTSDSNIKIEVWMPYSGWNGRFLGTGNGGIGGLIVYTILAYFLPLNYAVANTDMGTSPAATEGGRVLTGHPEKQIDFATRSTNLMTVRSKQIIKAFYSERPRYSYFLGCSTGGGQGVHEALQFPGDYDGIVAGAPLFNNTHHAAGNAWNYQAFNSSPANINADQATAISAAIVKKCVGKDGGLSSDNFLTDPRDCHWDPAALQCRGGADDAATCLTVQQVAAVRKLYEGPINPRTGERILAGRVRGSESNNGYSAVLASRPGSTNTIAYWVFGNGFDWLTFDFDQDMNALDDEQAARSNANSADLEEFRSRGGKLIITHGFADPLVPTLNTAAYYERLIVSQTREGRHVGEERKQSVRRTQDFARLFLLPGVGHCSGGAGPDTVEGDPFPPGPADPPPIARIALDPLVQWVEHGIAPDQIIAYHVTNAATDFSRPVCPYPALPRYSGAGDTTKASSFACVDDSDRDDNQPPASKYLNDGDNYPIVPIDDRDRGHDHDKH